MPTDITPPVMKDQMNVPLVGRPKIPAVVTIDNISPDRLSEVLFRLKELKDARPDFKATLFLSPNRFGPLKVPKGFESWVTFGIFGWEGCPYECLAWTSSESEIHIQDSLAMGYAPVFKAPNNAWDYEGMSGLIPHKVVLVHPSQQDPKSSGLLTYPGPQSLRGEHPVHARIFSTAKTMPVHPTLTPKEIRDRYLTYKNPTDYAIKVPGGSDEV